MNDVALRANDVLRNDVGLRPMMLRSAQTEFLPQVLQNTSNCAIIKSERRWGDEKNLVTFIVRYSYIQRCFV